MGGNSQPGFNFAFHGHGILKIENDRVCTTGGSFVKALRTITRYEQWRHRCLENTVHHVALAIIFSWLSAP
ncbi:hypothetical protein D3C86_1662760 [compost metagenome]